MSILPIESQLQQTNPPFLSFAAIPSEAKIALSGLSLAAATPTLVEPKDTDDEPKELNDERG